MQASVYLISKTAAIAFIYLPLKMILVMVDLFERKVKLFSKIVYLPYGW